MATAPAAALSYQPDLMAVAVEDPKEVYIPGLTDTSLFVTLPMTDGIAALIEKYIRPNQRPARDLTGNHNNQSLEQLIASHNWRAVANYCRNTITNSPTDQTAHILAHWTLRLHALLRLHLLPAFSAELAALLPLLPSPSDAPDAPLFYPAVPFELLVLRAALPGLRGAREEAVEGLAELVRGAKSEYWAARRGGEGVREGEGVWRERVERVGGLVKGLLGEIRAGPSAFNVAGAGEPTAALLGGLCRQHYATGDLASLEAAHARLQALPAADSDAARAARKASALTIVAKGDWVEAEKQWRALSTNNLAVALLYQAKLNDALALLTALLAAQPERVAHSEPVLFNLATLHELRTEQAVAAKVGVLAVVAGAGGQGIRHGALKLAV